MPLSSVYPHCAGTALGNSTPKLKQTQLALSARLAAPVEFSRKKSRHTEWNARLARKSATTGTEAPSCGLSVSDVWVREDREPAGGAGCEAPNPRPHVSLLAPRRSAMAVSLTLCLLPNGGPLP